MARWKHDKALVRAILEADEEEARKALAKGADPNHEIKNETYFNRPLTLAAVVGSASIVQLLLDHGADLEGTAADGRTAIFAATSPDPLRVLLEAGANVHAKDKHLQTALHYASRTKSAELLVEAGADPAVECIRGLKPHEAIQGTIEAVGGQLPGEIVEETWQVVLYLRSLAEGTSLETNTRPASASSDEQMKRAERRRI